MASPKERTLGVGPFVGVRQTQNPYDDQGPTLAGVGLNVYPQDAQSGGGLWQRPGTSNPVDVTGIIYGGMYCHTMSNGTVYNFVVTGDGTNPQRVYRWATMGASVVDVTPTGVTIAPTARVYFTSLADSIIVNDGANLPWIGTNLGGTPITATPIAYQTATPLLSIGSTDTAVANAAFAYLIAGTNYSKTATVAGTALPAGTIPADQWGVYRVSVVANGTLTVTAGAANYGAGYATEAAAIAALPALPANSWGVGSFTVQTATGMAFVAGTDALAGGASGNPANATNYYVGDPVPWTAFGQPVIYTGAVFFVLATVEGVSARTTIAWSEPNQPGTGYQQTDYDNAWTLTQTSAMPLYALAATNDALYYFRAFSVGAITGAPNINFQNTATHDVVSGNVGCVESATIAYYLNYVYFADQSGRPYRMAVGGAPEPIWQQASALFDSAGFDGGVARFAVVEPNLNVYLLNYIAADTSRSFVVFDAATGRYAGQWTFGTSPLYAAILWDAASTAAGGPHLGMMMLVETTSVPLYKLAAVADNLWTDNAAAMSVGMTTGRLGYEARDGYTFPRARAIVAYSGGTPAVTATFTTSQQVTAALTAAVVTSPIQSPLYRLTWQPGVMGRDVSVALASTMTGGQLRFYRVEVDAVETGMTPISDW